MTDRTLYSKLCALSKSTPHVSSRGAHNGVSVDSTRHEETEHRLSISWREATSDVARTGQLARGHNAAGNREAYR